MPSLKGQLSCLKETRPNIRSFRYSDRVEEILQGMEGDSLNDKFNNLVIYCFETLPKWEKMIEEAQNNYQKEREKVYDCQRKLSQISNIQGILKQLEYYGQLAERQLKNLAEDKDERGYPKK